MIETEKDADAKKKKGFLRLQNQIVTGRCQLDVILTPKVNLELKGLMII